MADRGRSSIRANEVVPRPRGAHAAAKQGRFRRSAPQTVLKPVAPELPVPGAPDPSDPATADTAPFSVVELASALTHTDTPPRPIPPPPIPPQSTAPPDAARPAVPSSASIMPAPTTAPSAPAPDVSIAQSSPMEGARAGGHGDDSANDTLAAGPDVSWRGSLSADGATVAAPVAGSRAERHVAGSTDTVSPLAVRRSVRSVCADVAAAIVVAVVVPLALLQVPDAIAFAIPPQFGSPGAETELLRAAGLALTAMATSIPFGGLAVRRFRAWPVLMTGLGIFAVADVLANTARTIAQVGLDRSLHGVGAGVALSAAVALAAERPMRSRRLLAGWFAICAVTGLAAASELMRHRLGGGNWRAALAPYPWLTGVALGLVALYALLADGAVTARMRSDFPAAERAQLALLTAPVAGMCAIAIAVSYGHSGAVTAAAVAEFVALAGLAIMTGRASQDALSERRSRSGTGWFAVVCAVTGFTVAPAAGAATDLIRTTTHSGMMLVGAIGGAVLCGAALAVALPARQVQGAVANGLALAAVGFATCYLAGLTGAGFTGADLSGQRVGLLAVACVPLAGGLALALGAAMRGLDAAGAMCGVVLMLAGVLAGYLADGAIELQAVSSDDRTAAMVRDALLTADGRWDLAAATLTGLVALVGFVRMLAGTRDIRRERPTSTEVDRKAGAPIWQADREPDHG